MVGLSILGDGTCSSGFNFYFSDGSTKSVGWYYGESSTLCFDNSNKLTGVYNYAGTILDILEICTNLTCVIRGNTGGRQINQYVPINPNLTITAFWGAFRRYDDNNCLEDFGVYGYL